MRGDDHFGHRFFVDKATNHPVEATVTNSEGSSEQQKQGKLTFPCIFCKGSHFNKNYEQYTTLCDRKQQL